MKAFFETLFGTSNYNLVIVGAFFVLFGVLLRTLLNYARKIKSKDTPAQWWAKKVFSFLLGCLLMRFLNLIVSIENFDYGFLIGTVFGLFPDVALHYLFSVKKKIKGRP